MPTLNEYFRTEAHDFLNALERSLQRSPAPDAAELHRAVRGLRGTAQMARDERIVTVVSAFESVTRSMAGDALAWSEHVAARARDTITDLRALLDGVEDDEQLDARVTGAAARWGHAPAAPAAVHAVDHSTREFREFAAREAAGIADTLDRGIQALQANPMDRDALRTVLRRQGALLGSARLEEIPVVADILRAIEDLTRVVAKLDVGVKQEWLDIYRVARDALQTTIAPLLRDELPQQSNSGSRLRHMREELLERYGTGAEESAPADHAFAQPAADLMAGAAAVDVAAPPAADHPTAPDEVLELAEDSVVESSADNVFELAEDSVVESPEDELFELAEDTVVESPGDSVFELAEGTVVESPGDSVFELAEDTVVESPDDSVFELAEDTVVESPEEDVFELAEDTVVESPDDAVLELGEDTVIDATGGEPGGSASGIDTLPYTREEALRRALELRDVIVRAAAHDPRAHAAAEELFDLIRTALG